MADVARAAGVSQQTVSRVANGLPNVNEPPRAEARYRRTHVNVLYFFNPHLFCFISPYDSTVHGRISTDYRILKK